MIYALLFVSHEPRRPSVTHPNFMWWLTQRMEQLVKQNYDFILWKLFSGLAEEGLIQHRGLQAYEHVETELHVFLTPVVYVGK
jgi:hypothetical protein